MSSEQYASSSSSGNPEDPASDGVSAELARMETDSSQEQDAGSSSQASGTNLSEVTRGAWMGSSVSQYEIDWLYRSRRIPEGVSCRIPGDEIEPVLEPGERVVFLAHFERGFGLPVSSFFRDFLDFYKLQPHHLPGNAIFYLSCYVTFMEAYIGIRPTRETFARFFALRINSVQGVDIPAPKPPVQCGSCIIGSRQASPFFKFSGLESCRLWQGTFFYVKNTGAADLIDLPPFDPAPPTKTNWSYNPKESHNETNRIIRFMKQRMKDTDLCSDDIIRTFISRRVLPLKRRAHKMSEMYGPGDPTKITGLPLSKKDVVLKARQICQTSMPEDWEWGLRPFSSTNPPTQEAKDRFPRIESDKRGRCRKRGLDKRIREWQCSAARAGADSALRVACSWYPELDLDALTGVREGAETDLDPILTAKRQDRAYRIAEYAEMRTFIPPPHGVQDYLDEEEDEAEEEPLDDAGAGDAPPEAPAA
ncbi:hypothetical protein QYE76_011347 [Lolium multiflorum]|uniref:Transposase (putative) gypsy type domain-containing protein n=1 Tax=Lolium multiflorum TaxID=4521 RepID=A0AAD8TZ15_LOLMU|nr:hypothetical protein QYE76_011347 [Lolium multiflorum]